MRAICHYLARMSLHHSLLAAQGYLELDMAEEALRELDEVVDSERDREDVLQMRLFIMMRLRRWEGAVLTCGRLRETLPAESAGYIHGAFCLHEMGRTLEARKLLLESPETLHDDPTYHYNLGCYEAVLGNVEEAQRHLRTSFRMDNKFRELAMDDPDLLPVRALLES
jgi:tetratricopeptide (TPR) repeat protein